MCAKTSSSVKPPIMRGSCGAEPTAFMYLRTVVMDKFFVPDPWSAQVDSTKGLQLCSARLPRWCVGDQVEDMG